MQQRVNPPSPTPFLVSVQPSSSPVAEPEVLSSAQREKALLLILSDSYFSHTITTLTTGVFMVGVALKLGAPNLLIGLLVAITSLSQLLQLPGIYLVEKLGSRRVITFWATLISRIFLLPMALSPLIPDPTLALGVLTVSYLLHACIGAIGTCAWNSWMRDVVPTHMLGAFFSRKMALASLITIVLTLLGGCLLSEWSQWHPENKVAGYSLLFGVAFLAGIAGLPLLKGMPEPALKPVAVQLAPSGQQQSLAQKLQEPFQHKNFRRLLTFMGTWHFAINLATPFFTVYMLTMLHFSMSQVTLMVIISQIAYISYLGIWGKLADRFSNKSVLRICGPLFLICLLAWTFTTWPDRHALTMPLVALVHVFIGISNAGVTLANGNLAMKLAPSEKATVYLATNNMVAALATGIAPLFGGFLADIFARQQLSLVLHWQAPGHLFNLKTLDFTAWDFFFGLAFLLGLFAMSRLKAVREVGQVKQQIVWRQMMNETWHSTLQLPCRITGMAGSIVHLVNTVQQTARQAKVSVSGIWTARFQVRAIPQPQRVPQAAWQEAHASEQPADYPIKHFQ